MSDYSQKIPGYASGSFISDYTIDPRVVPDSSYWGGDPTLFAPSWGAPTKQDSRSSLQQPSIWDAVKEGLYRGLTRGISGGLGIDLYGRNPFSDYTPEAKQRMAGEDQRAFGALPEYLRYDVQRLLNPKLNVRPTSIYSGFLR